jgi:hypothetical protein
VLAVLTLLAAGCVSGARWEETLLRPAGADLGSFVDSPEATPLLAELISTRPRAERSVGHAQLAVIPGPSGSLPAPAQRELPDAAHLLEMAQEVSSDFAALSFARMALADPTSRTVKAAFERFLHDGRSEDILREHEAFPYTVLFAPAWSYRSHPSNGADFARQRRLMDKLGIEHRLIATDESGSVEDNASTIAAAVREETRRSRSVIVVSASKSGAEVALALSSVLAPDEAASVAGWLNVAGALRGSPLADVAVRPPASWLVRLVFRWANWKWSGLVSMTTAASRKRLEMARMPESIAVVNLVPVPVSGTVGPKVFFSHQILLPYGPNDGVVLLADTIWPGGANLVEIGPDHLLSSRHADARDVALLRAMDFAVRHHRTLHPRPPSDEGAARISGVY